MTESKGCYAKLLRSSRSTETGSEVHSFELRFPRFVLAEFNTHRVFSRNSASSRAIPVHKRIQSVIDDPMIPFEFGRNQRGMQAGEEIADAAAGREAWLHGRDAAVTVARELMQLGVHKQVANRVLEPYLWHTCVLTLTDWKGFVEQRLHAAAQPEIRELAECFVEEMGMASGPSNLIRGQFHLPYLRGLDTGYLFRLNLSASRIGAIIQAISTARCARVSYHPFDLDSDAPLVDVINSDIDLFNKLVTSTPTHWSPLEHVCTPAAQEERPQGNLRGWHQLRHLLAVKPLLMEPMPTAARLGM